LKNIDKSKLIYWNEQVQINGNEKYLILSADFILDQDSFWERKHPSAVEYEQTNYINKVNLTSTQGHGTSTKGNSCSVRQNTGRNIINTINLNR
jgi:hypothetical protein